MLYENYKRKVIKISEILKKIKRYRALIITAAVVIFALITTMLSFKGAVFSVKEIPFEITYGQAPECSAKAFMGRVWYEYADQDGEEWSLTAPKRTGEYRVRAAAKRLFGAPNYGKEQSFQILPKSIDVNIAQENVPYGDDPAISADLEFNDVISCFKFDYQDFSQAKTKVTADKSSVKITDKNGIDATCCYTINVIEGDITIVSRALTVAAGDLTAVYDGTPFYCREYQITEGSLAYNDIITAEFNNFQTNAGETENIAEIKITSESGSDVTGRYNIKAINGKLKIEKRPLSIATYGAQKVYDGQPLTSENFTINADTPMPQGHGLILINSSRLIDAGECQNILTFKITDGTNEVTDNYILNIEASNLKIDKRAIKIKTNDASKVYDGKPLTDNNYTIISTQKLVENHTLQLNFTNSQADAGQSENIAAATVIDIENDLTHNYEFEYVYGVLSIAQRAVTILTDTAEFVYNGKPQSSGGYTVVSEMQLADGQSIKPADGTLTAIVNVTANPVDNIFIAAVFDAKGNDVTHNYIIDYRYGRLTVTHLNIEVSTRSADLYYTGEWQSHPLFDAEPKIIAGQTAKIKGEPPALKDVEPIDENEYKSYSNEFEIEIFDKNTDVTSNYIIRYTSYGVLRMLPRLITITTADKEFIYNGQFQSDDSLTTDPAPAAGHSIHIRGAVPSIKNVGEIENKFEIDILDEANNNVNYFYIIKYEYNTIKILPRVASVVTTFAEWIYDAKEHSNPNFAYSGLVEGQTFKIITDTITTITDVIRLENDKVGSTDNIFAVEVFDGDENVTSNYKIEYSYGKLTILPRPLTILTNSNEWVYDALPHYDNGITVTKGSLVEGHESLGYAPPQITNVIRLKNNAVGSLENKFQIFILYWVDDVSVKYVMSNYEITYVYGFLTILPRPIEITTNSNEWTYDGEPHRDTGYEITDGELVVGQISFMQGFVPYITNVIRLKDNLVGSLENKFEIIIFSGIDRVEYNYDITYVYGGLKILPRPLTLNAEWGYRDYSGEPVDCPYYYISLGSVVEGQFLIAEFCSYIEIGTYENIITGIWIYHGDEDVTYNYDITLQKGTLIIQPRYLYVYAGYADKEYDGIPLTNANYYSNNLLAGHFLTAKTVGEQTEPGISYNRIAPDSLKITDAKGNDVSHLYRVSYGYSELHVWERQITVKTYSAEKDYDGAPLMRDGYELIGELLEGHTEEVYVYGSRTSVGQSANSFTVYIIDSYGNDVTGRYYITRDWGLLTVYGDLDLDGNIDREGSGGGASPEVLFTATSDVKSTVYFRAKSFGDYLINGSWVNAAPYLSGGVNALYLMPVSLNQTGRQWAHISIEPKHNNFAYLLPYYALDGYGGSLDDTRLNVVYDSAYSFNYIPYTYNHNDKLSLNGSYWDFEAEYYQYVLNTYLQLPTTTRAKMLEIAAKNNLSANSPSIITDVAKFVQNKVKYSKQFNYLGDIAVYFFTQAKTGICQHYATAATAMLRALGIPARYTVGFVGEMSAGKAVEVTTEQAHAWVEVYIPGAGWVNIEVTGAGDGSGNGGGGGGDGGGGEIGGGFKLEIKPVDVYKRYDGTPLFAKNEVEGNDLDSINLLNKLLDAGYRYAVTVGGSRIEPGVSDSYIVDFLLYDAYGRNVTDNYEISYALGRIRIIDKDKEVIVINLFSLQKYYDGKPLSYLPDDYWTDDVPEGFTLSLNLVGTLTDAGIMKLSNFENLPFAVYDKSGKNVSALFTLVFEGEPLRIDRRVIEITSASATKTYDGRPLTSNITWISKGYFVPGHRYEAAVSGSITDIGVGYNTIAAVTIYDERGKEITANYLIIKFYGLLTIRDV